MTSQTLATFIRWKANVNTSNPWDDTSLLPIVNIAKDNISQAIAQVNSDYFGEKSTTDSIAGQGEYTNPGDLMLFKRIEVSYTSTATGNFYPATPVSLDGLSPYGEDWYQANQSSSQPLVRFDDTGFNLYPAPTSTSAGLALIRMFYVPKRPDLTSLTDTTDLQSLTGIGTFFHELIGDYVVNQIRFKKGELSAQDVQDFNAHIVDELVPSAFRKVGTTQSSLPPDTGLQY